MYITEVVMKQTKGNVCLNTSTILYYYSESTKLI